MRRIFSAVLVSLLLTVPVVAADKAPIDLARQATDKIIELLKTNKDAYAKDHKKLYAMVDEHVLPHFDFRAMSRTVLGRYWREATEDQRTQFSKEFRDLLVRTYATALLKYNDEQIIYLPFRMSPEDRTAVVKAEVRRRDGGPPVAIQYNFYRPDASWKVYDVAIEGASLVSTYQSTFAARVQKEGLAGLIASLAQDNKQPASKTASGGKAGSGP